MTAAAPPLLEVEDLHVDYAPPGERVEAVEGIDLRVDGGETLGLVGESGAGKSTALMALPGLLPPEARVRPPSSVRLGGTQLVGAPASTLRGVRGSRIGVVFQEPGASLNPVRRVGRQVAEAVRRGRGLSGSHAEREVVRLLEVAGLDEPERVAAAYPGRLSGGMQQRVGLAAAVGGGPSLLLADEPTAALDVALEAEVLDRLVRLQRDGGMGMILVSHDLRVVAGVADRVAVMYAGRVVEEGAAEEVLGEPAHPYTRGLLEAAPRLDGPPGLTPAVPGEPPRAGERPDGCRFRPRCRHAWERCHREPGLLDGPGPSRSVRCWLEEEPERRRTPEDRDADVSGTDGGRRGSPPTDGDGSPLLRAEGLSRTFRAGGRRRRGGRSVVAAEDVSLRVDPAEAVGLVGESGAGKSTVARMLTGAEPPDGGRLSWRGRPVEEMGRAERGQFRRGAQLLHQDAHASLNPRMTVGAALREPLEAHGLAEDPSVARGRAEELLEHVGLPREAAGRRPRELSGGERQRVALARALTVRPRLLAADEPVSALDVSVQAQVLALLSGLRGRFGLALLLVAHDLAVVRQLCDRVLVLHRGRVVERGPTERILRSPEHPRTRRLVEAARSRGRHLP